MKLHNYDLVVIGNIRFKFQPDRTESLAAGKKKKIDLGYFIYLFE